MLWHTIPDGGADGETEREEREMETVEHLAQMVPDREMEREEET